MPEAQHPRDEPRSARHPERNGVARSAARRRRSDSAVRRARAGVDAVVRADGRECERGSRHLPPTRWHSARHRARRGARSRAVARSRSPRGSTTHFVCSLPAVARHYRASERCAARWTGATGSSIDASRRSSADSRSSPEASRSRQRKPSASAIRSRRKTFSTASPRSSTSRSSSWKPGDGVARYRLLETVRQYGFDAPEPAERRRALPRAPRAPLSRVRRALCAAADRRRTRARTPRAHCRRARQPPRRVRVGCERSVARRGGAALRRCAVLVLVRHGVLVRLGTVSRRRASRSPARSRTRRTSIRCCARERSRPTD